MRNCFHVTQVCWTYMRILVQSSVACLNGSTLVDRDQYLPVHTHVPPMERRHRRITPRMIPPRKQDPHHRQNIAFQHFCNTRVYTAFGKPRNVHACWVEHQDTVVLQVPRKTHPSLMQNDREEQLHQLIPGMSICGPLSKYIQL